MKLLGRESGSAGRRAARWWHAHPVETNKVICTLCPRECHIPDGARGFCFVRANENGRLMLTAYGRSSGFCVDPIEKKPLNHFLPGTSALSLGTAGCNLACRYCQNWDLSRNRAMETMAQRASPEAVVEAAKRAGCRSIALTYNDPVIWAEYAIDIAKVARRNGLKTVAVTAGYMNAEPRREFFEWMDAANVDLKAFSESFYKSLTFSHLQPVLETLKHIRRETNAWLEITNLVIPGENDSMDEVRRMCDWIVKHLGPDIPVHFTAFHPDFKMQDHPPTPHRTLVKARETAMLAGVQFAYVGNVHDKRNESTYCHACGCLLIARDRYRIGLYRVRDQRCGLCGAAIPGVFEDEPGRGGSGSQPVHSAP